LGPASRIEVPAKFGEATRTMAMTGEALFEVTHDVAHPFVVTDGSMPTETIGTRFDIRKGDNSRVLVTAPLRTAMIRFVRYLPPVS
jgi:ferric-dicitrate binding protein FerR (iron transport regulator)